MNKTCTVADCERLVLARGLCRRHYQRLSKHGDVNYNAKERPLAERFWEKVDKSGDCWEWTASITTGGYGQFNAYGREHSPKPAHRISYELLVGPIPEGLVMDHICRNRRCVKPEHLRPTTVQLNTEYRERGRTRVPASGYRGVYRNKGGWQAKVTHEGVLHYLGTYPDKEEAARVAAEKRRELFQFPEYQRSKR